MAAPRRRLSLLALLVAFAGFYALAGYSMAASFLERGPGFVFYDNFSRDLSVGAVPSTSEAAEKVAGMQGILRVLEIDGVDPLALPGGAPYPVRARRAALRTDATRFVIVDGEGERRALEVSDGVVEPSALPGVVFVGFAYQLVGLFYLAVGLFVWVRRPQEPSAAWLLGLGVLAATHLAQPAPDTPLGWLLNGYVAAAMLPLYGPVVVGLVLAFTGIRGSRRLRGLWLGVSAFAGVTVASLPFVLHLWTLEGGSAVLRGLLLAVGLELFASVALFMWVARRAMAPDKPPAMRRRARLLALATGISFGLPTLELVILPFVDAVPLELVVPNLVCLAAFPVIIAYSILRYQAFDLRIALRRGAVYAVLSLLVSLAFVGVVLLLVDVVGERAQSGVALWLTSMVLVVGVGLLQLRVQALVDGWANAKQDRYARGIAGVSDELVRAHDLAALSRTAERALIEVMGLSRAYVAMRDGAQVRCFLLANLDDPTTGRAPAQVPTQFALDEMPPVERAAALEEMTTAYDGDALPSMVGAAPLAADFWSAYGLEVVVPLMRKLDGERAVIGFLLLGPRLDGQPLDEDDRGLVRQLANQLTVAAENTLAFEQIRALKEGLEEKVRARTRELEQALEDLESAEAQIVETEKQAMLGRLVAGIVHEVNTPLGALRSSADTLARLVAKLDAELEEGAPARRRLRMAEELTTLQITSTGRLSEIMDSLRSFVSLDEAEVVQVDVREGIDSALALLGGELGGGVQVERAYPEVLPRVRAPAHRLNQVFLQVLQNAAKAVGAGGRIAVRVEHVQDRLRIEVTDDGPGIPSARQGDLFEFGFTKKRGRVGLRLGLPTSARTVRELGGEILIESVEGEGTTVRVELPTG